MLYLHQCVDAVIDLTACRLRGSTELTIQPAHRNLHQIKLNARGLDILRVTVDQRPAVFNVRNWTYLDGITDDQATDALKAGGATLQRRITDAFLEFEDGELTIENPWYDPHEMPAPSPPVLPPAAPPKVDAPAVVIKVEPGTEPPAAATSGPTPPPPPPATSSAPDAPPNGDAKAPTLAASPPPPAPEIPRLVVRIEYVLNQSSSPTVVFAEPSGPHLASAASADDDTAASDLALLPTFHAACMPQPASAESNLYSIYGTARHWMPCVDRVHEKATWDLHFELVLTPTTDEPDADGDRAMGDVDAPPPSSNLAAALAEPVGDDGHPTIACTGQLMAHGGQHWHFHIGEPVGAPLIAVAAGIFRLHVIPLDIPVPDDAPRYPPRAVHVYSPPFVPRDVVHHSTYIVGAALDFYSDEFAMYPYGDFGVHRLVYTHDVVAPCAFTHHGAGMTLFDVTALAASTRPDATLEHRRAVMHALAYQWFGCWIQPKNWGDYWVLLGLSAYMASRFFRSHFGKSEYQYRLKKDIQRLAVLDVHMPPLYYLPHVSVDFLCLKAALVIYALDKKMTKVAASSGMTACIQKMLAAGTRSLSGNGLQRWIRKESAVDGLRPFWTQWIESAGVPRIEFSYSQNNGRQVIEFEMAQENTSVWRTEAGMRPTLFTGSISVTVFEIDGCVYTHALDVARATQHFEVRFNSRYKYKKMMGKTNDAAPSGSQPAAGSSSQPASQAAAAPPPAAAPSTVSAPRATGPTVPDEEEWLAAVKDDNGSEQHRWIQWVWVDQDVEWPCPVTLKQPDFKWLRLLTHQPSVLAQFDIVSHLRHYPSLQCAQLLHTLAMDTHIFYRLRADAALALSACAVPSTDWVGLEMLHGLLAQYTAVPSAATGAAILDVVPLPHAWTQMQEFFVYRATLQAIVLVRNDAGHCPHQVKRLFIHLLRYHDRSVGYVHEAEVVSMLLRFLCQAMLVLPSGHHHHHHHHHPRAQQQQADQRAKAAGRSKKASALPTASLAEIAEDLDMGFGFLSESENEDEDSAEPMDTSAETPAAAAAATSVDPFAPVGKYGLVFGPSAELMEQALQQVERVRVMDLMSSDGDNDGEFTDGDLVGMAATTSACLSTLCQWMLGALVPARYSLFLEYTDASYPRQVRQTAFQCLFLLQAYLVDAVGEYLLHTMMVDASPQIRVSLAQYFVNAARMVGAGHDRAALRERRAQMLEAFHAFTDRALPTLQKMLGNPMVPREIHQAIMSWIALALTPHVARVRVKWSLQQTPAAHAARTGAGGVAAGAIMGPAGAAGAGSGRGWQPPYAGLPPTQRVGPVPPILYNAGLAVIERLKDHEMAPPFELPVSPTVVGYYDLIKDPMDLSCVEKRFKNGQYRSLCDMFNDIDKIFRNCFAFNQESSEVVKQAKILKQYFETEVAPDALALVPTGPTPPMEMTEDEWKRCRKIARKLREKKSADPFLKPVTGVRKYYDVIKQPMDLSTIRKKLEDREYATVGSFEADVNRMFDNCFKFNAKDDPYYNAGKELQAEFQREWRTEFPVQLKIKAPPRPMPPPPPPSTATATVLSVPHPLPGPSEIKKPAVASMPAPGAHSTRPGAASGLTSPPTIRITGLNKPGAPSSIPAPAPPKPGRIKIKPSEASSLQPAVSHTSAPSNIPAPPAAPAPAPADVPPAPLRIKVSRLPPAAPSTKEPAAPLAKQFAHPGKFNGASKFAASAPVEAPVTPARPAAGPKPLSSRNVISASSMAARAQALGMAPPPPLPLASPTHAAPAPVTGVVVSRGPSAKAVSRPLATPRNEPVAPPPPPASSKALRDQDAPRSRIPRPPAPVAAPAPPPPSYAPPPPPTPVPEEEEEEFVDLHPELDKLPALYDRLYGYNEAFDFRLPVDPVALGLHDYFDVIKHPMDLKTIGSRLEEYESPEEVLDDLRLMLQNAITYNHRETAVYKDSFKFYRIICDEWRKTFGIRGLPALEPHSKSRKSSIKLSSRSHSRGGSSRPVRPNITTPVNATMTAWDIDMCRGIVQVLQSANSAGPFLEPVDPIRDGVPTYFDTIGEPMDLRTLRENLENRDYATLTDFEHDVDLIFENCYRFNGREHEISGHANVLRAMFRTEWKRFLVKRRNRGREGQLRPAPRPTPTEAPPLAYSGGLHRSRKTSVGIKEPAPLAHPTASVSTSRGSAVGPSSMSSPAAAGASRGLHRATTPPSTAAEQPFDATKARKILDKLHNHVSSWPFLVPVDPVALQIPQYFDIIKYPMDFGTIKTKIKSRAYASMAQFVRDVQLVYDNCFTFNRPGEPVYVAGENSQRVFRAECARMGVSTNVGPYMPPGTASAAAGSARAAPHAEKKRKQPDTSRETSPVSTHRAPGYASPFAHQAGSGSSSSLSSMGGRAGSQDSDHKRAKLKVNLKWP
ncbi:hypothetical protein AMAG_08383 [Allomyces macrogynus ATCC 38327]|uniref:Transcription initiation factor TFIID subunit 2 n=1 Tax=Allomyces macrogynus (strain ATCC 38327) TaxID=578462 RepID=A0A0L0SLH2_ALLM3|nr:hypothetical protein AMAG_08383 [Allomyces macrogynus ATCC 38327]|eukprot:KNE63234.1 hypothetical protein AMAG_08383 [Allomyces macrogynus ATCC 38327]